MPSFTFQNMLEGFVPVERSNFKQAYTDMYNWVRAQTSLSYQVLETAICIECSNRRLPLDFYDATDRAHEEGVLLPTGKLAE